MISDGCCCCCCCYSECHHWHVAVQSIEPNNFISTISILIFCPFIFCFRFFFIFDVFSPRFSCSFLFWSIVNDLNFKYWKLTKWIDFNNSNQKKIITWAEQGERKSSERASILLPAYYVRVYNKDRQEKKQKQNTYITYIIDDCRNSDKDDFDNGKN